MAQSINLGGSTFLDSSAVAINDSGKTLGATIAYLKLETTTALDSSTIVSLLNTYNSSITQKILVIIEFIYTTSDYRTVGIFHKTSATYGAGYCFGFYGTGYRYLLSNGTWSAVSI